MSQVYLDHAATTPLDPRVHQAMLPFLMEAYGNASSFHIMGKQAQDALNAARATISGILGVHADEVIFTAGGTEANNLAILGVARAAKTQGKTHLVMSAIEHHSVLGPMEHLAKHEGFTLTVVPVDVEGRVSAAALLAAIRPETALVSVMLANNEIGTIQPVAEIGKGIAALRGAQAYPLLHTDACQAAGALDLFVPRLHADLLTLNAAKIYGPKGVGCLYVRRGVKLVPLLFGGQQERGIRPGTENVAGAVGFAKALALAEADREAESQRLTELRDALIAGIKARVPRVRLNGHPTERLPNNVNVTFLDVEGEALALYLDAKGIEVSTGSACTSASLDPSHVLLALGLPYEAAHGSIRFTLGRQTTREDISYVLEALPPVVEKLRAISPIHLSDTYLQSGPNNISFVSRI